MVNISHFLALLIVVLVGFFLLLLFFARSYLGNDKTDKRVERETVMIRWLMPIDTQRFVYLCPKHRWINLEALNKLLNTLPAKWSSSYSGDVCKMEDVDNV